MLLCRPDTRRSDVPLVGIHLDLHRPARGGFGTGYFSERVLLQGYPTVEPMVMRMIEPVYSISPALSNGKSQFPSPGSNSTAFLPQIHPNRRRSVSRGINMQPL